MRFCLVEISAVLPSLPFLPLRYNSLSLSAQCMMNPSNWPPCAADRRSACWRELSLRRQHTILGLRGEPRGWNRCQSMPNSNSALSIAYNGYDDPPHHHLGERTAAQRAEETQLHPETVRDLTAVFGSRACWGALPSTREIVAVGARGSPKKCWRNWRA